MCVARLTRAYFAVCLCCSVALIAPLLSDAAKRTPYWKAWVAHVRVLEVSLRDKYRVEDATLLDTLITQHHKLFLQVSAPVCYAMCAQLESRS